MSDIQNTTINDLPLDCIRLIAQVSIPAYRAMLLIKRFALTTLGLANRPYRSHFIVLTHGMNGQGYRYIEYKLNDMVHQEDDEPAVIFEEGFKMWCKFGKIHRDNDLPAKEYSEGYREWWINGRVHRDGDKPAALQLTDDPDDYRDVRWWKQHGEFHRDGDQPAEIDNYTQKWYQRDKLHRDNGLPAVIRSNNTFEWWVNGVRIDKQNN
jgi:hypothetical protein